MATVSTFRPIGSGFQSKCGKVARAIMLGAMSFALTAVAVADDPWDDPSPDPWTFGAFDGEQALLGSNQNDRFTTDPIYGKSDRSRAVILNKVNKNPATDDDTREDHNPLLIGLEVRERTETNAQFVDTEESKVRAKSTLAILGEAVRDGTEFPLTNSFGGGVQGRAVQITESWDSENYAASKDNFSKAVGVSGVAGFFDPKDDEPTLRDGSEIKTGFVQEMYAGEFNVLGDNSYFSDPENTSGIYDGAYSALRVYGIAARFITGFFTNAPPSGAHVQNVYNIATNTALNGTYDRIENAYGVYVESARKKSEAGSTGARQAEADAAIGNSYGVFIDEPRAPHMGSDDYITPTNYIGLMCKAAAKFTAPGIAVDIDKDLNIGRDLYVKNAQCTGYAEFNDLDIIGTLNASLNASQLASGIVPVARMGSGTNADIFTIDADSTDQIATLRFHTDFGGPVDMDIKANSDLEAFVFIRSSSYANIECGSVFSSGYVETGSVQTNYVQTLGTQISGSAKSGTATVLNGNSSVSISGTWADTAVIIPSWKNTDPGADGNLGLVVNVTGSNTANILVTSGTVTANRQVNWRVID